MAKLSKREAWSAKTGLPKEQYSSSSGSGMGQLGALERMYMGSLEPSKDELNAEKQLNNIIASKELGIAKVEREPMAQDFVTGQSVALEKSAALKALPLETKLASLQARRASASDVLKAKLGFDQDERDFNEGVRQFNLQEARLKKNNSNGNALSDLASLLGGQQGSNSSGFDYGNGW